MVASLAELASLDTHRVYMIVGSSAPWSWELRHVGRDDNAPISTCTVWSVRMLAIKLADYLRAAYATGGAVDVTRRSI